MFEHLDDPSPPQPGARLRHDVLAAVARRRWMRRIAVAGAGGAVVAAVAVVAATGAPSRGSVHVASRATTTSVTLGPGSTVPGTAPTLQPPTTVTGTPGTGTTDRHPSPIPVPTTSGATTTRPANCTDADLRSATSTDRASYAPGVSVQITITVRNVSGHTCEYDHGICWNVTIQDSAGAEVWTSYGEGGPVACPASLVMEPLGPGAAARPMSFTWDRQVCASPPTTSTTSFSSHPCRDGPAPAGTYRAVGRADTTQPSTSPPFDLQ